MTTNRTLESVPGYRHDPPQVARVSVATLRAIRRALWGVEPGEVERLDAQLEHLIVVAQEAAWRL